jgi:hypothetical protein
MCNDTIRIACMRVCCEIEIKNEDMWATRVIHCNEHVISCSLVWCHNKEPDVCYAVWRLLICFDICLMKLRTEVFP